MPQPNAYTIMENILKVEDTDLYPVIKGTVFKRVVPKGEGGDVPFLMIRIRSAGEPASEVSIRRPSVELFCFGGTDGLSLTGAKTYDKCETLWLALVERLTKIGNEAVDGGSLLWAREAGEPFYEIDVDTRWPVARTIFNCGVRSAS